MRTTRIMAVLIASVMSASVVQAQQAAPGAASGQRGMGHGKGMRRGHGGGELMRGIELSDAEKAKLKDIREKYKAEARPLRESLKPAMQEARAARQKGDTAAARAAWDRTRADRDKLKSLMERGRVEMRSALSAEHQAQFDANVAQRKQRGEGAGGHGMGRKDRGGHRRT